MRRRQSLGALMAAGTALPVLLPGRAQAAETIKEVPPAVVKHALLSLGCGGEKKACNDYNQAIANGKPVGQKHEYPLLAAAFEALARAFPNQFEFRPNKPQGTVALILKAVH